jgi:zinc D-Ala-D-Ala dipeptidase
MNNVFCFLKTLFCLFLLVEIFGCTSMYTNDRPLSQDRSHFVSIAIIDPSIKVEMRYFGENNFVGRRVIGYNANVCLLTRESAFALGAAQKELLKDGYTIKVQDCYRPQKAVNDFVAWSKDALDQKNKKIFYPDVDKTKVFELGYVASHSGHSRGSTVDLVLERVQDSSLVDMGTTFDFFSELSNTENSAITGDAHKNREILKAAMEKQGFKNYEKEWWHYTLNDEAYPMTYFDFDIDEWRGAPAPPPRREGKRP